MTDSTLKPQDTTISVITPTLRDQIAIAALQGLLSSTTDEDVPPDMTKQQWKDKVAVGSYEYADAMLRARKKEG